MGFWERLEHAIFERHAVDPMALWATGESVGQPVHAGVEVNQQTALRLSVVWRCIRLISETLAGLPADIVRRRGDIREPVERPPAWLQTPNPESTWFEFVERVLESLLMDGNGFLLITARDAQGFASEIWVLNPARVEVRRDERTRRIVFVVDGETFYSRFGPDDPLGDILHIRLATAGALRGLSPIEAARQSIGLGLVTEKFGARFFGKGQQLSGVIEMPAGDPVRTREYVKITKENWSRDHGGSERSHLPGVLTGGATWKPLSISPEDAQFLQTRAFQVEDIASRIYGIPPHLVGLTEKQTSWGTGVEQQGIGLYRFTLRGHIIRLESALSQLVPRGNFLRLNPRALLEADSETEAKVLQMELQNGVISRNDWRAILDKPPISGGDRMILPLNFQILTPGGTAIPAPAPNPNGQQPAEVVSE